MRIYADCHAGDALESITPLLVPRDPQWMRAAGEAERQSLVSLKHHGWDASGEGSLTPESYGRRAREMAARGFGILKFDVDVPTPYETDEYNRDLSHLEIEHMASLVAATREAVGMGVGLAIDCHWNYGVQAAIDLARAVEKYKLLWLEDPVPPDNIRALGVVQRETRVPIATGENHYFRLDFERLIVEAGLRVLAPDVQKIGLWEGRKIADLADMHYVNLTLHNISSPHRHHGGRASVRGDSEFPGARMARSQCAVFRRADEGRGGAADPGRQDRGAGQRRGWGSNWTRTWRIKYRKPGEKFFGD